MSTFIRYGFACLFAIFTSQLCAQDIHLSHIHASPIVLNPAMTGLFTGKTRLIGNAKSQWNSITNGYRTAVGSIDTKLWEFRNADMIGGGLQIASDHAGDLDFTTTSIGLSFSVLKSLTGKGDNYVSFGLQNSFISNRVDYSQIIAFSEEPSVANGASNKVRYWDLSAGLAWFYSIDRFNSFYLGGSLFHINEPNVSFFQNGNASEGYKLFRRWVIHGGGDFKLGKKSYLKPSFIFQDQGPHREITVGSFLKYKTLKSYRSKAPSSVYFGTWLRWAVEKDFFGTDAVVVAARIDYNKTYLTFTFDVNISSLTRVSYGRGGPEFSVVHILESKGRRQPTKVRCPDF